MNVLIFNSLNLSENGIQSVKEELVLQLSGGETRKVQGEENWECDIHY